MFKDIKELLTQALWLTDQLALWEKIVFQKETGFMHEYIVEEYPRLHMADYFTLSKFITFNRYLGYNYQ